MTHIRPTARLPPALNGRRQRTTLPANDFGAGRNQSRGQRRPMIEAVRPSGSRRRSAGQWDGTDPIGSDEINGPADRKSEPAASERYHGRTCPSSGDEAVDQIELAAQLIIGSRLARSLLISLSSCDKGL